MSPQGRRAHYHSYLLRLWRPDAGAPWQASLQSTASGETRTFTELDSLWAFLLQRLDRSDPPAPPEEVNP